MHTLLRSLPRGFDLDAPARAQRVYLERWNSTHHGPPIPSWVWHMRSTFRALVIIASRAGCLREVAG